MAIQKAFKNGKKKLWYHQQAKTLYYFIIMTILFVITFLIHSGYDYDLKVHYTNAYNKAAYVIRKIIENKRTDGKSSNTKYILLWTPVPYLPYGNFTKGIFENKSCKWKNCLVTEDRNYLNDYTEFDLIFFHGPKLSELLYFYDIPRKRSPNQKYVYGNMESESYNPMCSNIWNDYFNWTWTYRLDSDCVWAHFVVRNSEGNVIGPSREMHWIDFTQTDDIGHRMKIKLITKNKLAAIFLSDCNTMSRREDFLQELDRELIKYHQRVDFFGNCGKHDCPESHMPRCLILLEKHYYFYLAFENSINEDYVTEKVMHALQHNTVPVVFGGANYSRFMPPGSYLNARELGPKQLAKTMNSLMHNPEEYRRFFKWKKYYSFHYRDESPETDDFCQFCALLNDDQQMKTPKVYKKFNSWWSGENSSCFERILLVNNINTKIKESKLKYVPVPFMNN